jgi:hypothetical protein
MASSAWMKEFQERMKKATTEVNTALQPRVIMAKRSLEEGMLSMGLRQGREVYDEDEELYYAVCSLDDLRGLLRSLSNAVETHRTNLLAAAATEKALGDIISGPTSSIASLLESRVSENRLECHLALGAAQLSTSSSLLRFALDMSTPMADLMRTFEETYSSKITPLKRMYISQKTEYTRYVRQAAAAEDEVRRSNLESIAHSARPVWERTSETLRSEIQRLVVYATSNVSEWMLNVSQAEAETYLRSAHAFEDVARQAEANQQE